MSKRGRGGASGNKYKMTLGLPVGAVMNCADNTGAKNLYIIAVYGIKGRLKYVAASGKGRGGKGSRKVCLLPRTHAAAHAPCVDALRNARLRTTRTASSRLPRALC